MLHAPALSIIPALYAKYSAVSFTAIGLILILTRSLDAITDPMVGYLSDRIETRMGMRKPWIVAGMFLCCLGAWFWLRPGADTGWPYFLVWSVCVYAGWTLIEIPHSAWLGELSRDYAERSSLAAYRTLAYFLGIAVFLSLPLWPLFASAEMTPEVTALASWLIVLSLPLFVLILLLKVPSVSRGNRIPQPLLGNFRTVIRNRPFRIFGISVLCANLASGMVAGMYFFFLDNVLGILDKIAHIGLMAATVSIVASFAWGPIAAKFGKHRVMALGALVNVGVLSAMGMLGPGPWAFPLMVFLFSISAIFNSGGIVASYALLADIVDYDTLKTGNTRFGSYYSILTFLNKFGLGVGGGASFLFASAFGFNASGGAGEGTLFGFYLAFILLPIVLNATAAVTISFFPINRRRHAIIQRRLASRRITVGE
jgi:GPH family glycoside/pentoside/hexuronide:cation symporter